MSYEQEGEAIVLTRGDAYAETPQIPWRAFAGRWERVNPDWAHLDRRGLTWAAARDALLSYLARYETDECADCRRAGIETSDELRQLSSSTEWRGEVDGEDYLLVKDA
jgi:hypothetical protein